MDRLQPSGLRYSPNPGPYEGGRIGGTPAISQAGGDYGRSVPPRFVEDVIKSTKGTVGKYGNLLHEGVVCR